MREKLNPRQRAERESRFLFRRAVVGLFEIINNKFHVVERMAFVSRSMKMGVAQRDFVEFEFSRSQIEEARVQTRNELVGAKQRVARLVGDEEAVENDIVKKLKINALDFDARFEFF